MKREKVLSGLLTAAMCLSLLAGCGGGNQDSKPSDNQGGNSQQEEGNSGEINFDEEPYEIVLENLTLG